MPTPSEETNVTGAGMTAKELLSEVRIDVKALVVTMNTLVAQNLDQRLRDMESWRDAVSVEGARMTSDPLATPVGKALEEGRIANARRISRLERSVWIANGAVAAFVLILQVLPGIIHLLSSIPTK